MGIYEKRLYPILKETAEVIEKTPHMLDILHGTMTPERMKFQIKQNYQYLLDYTKCWAVAFAKCDNYQDMSQWYLILKNTIGHDC